MRYTGEMRKVLLGNQVKAHEMIPVARTMAAEVMQRARLGNLSILTDSKLVDGVSITVSVINGAVVAVINAPAVTVEEQAVLPQIQIPTAVESCPVPPTIPPGTLFTEALGIALTDMTAESATENNITMRDIGFDFCLYGLTTNMWFMDRAGTVKAQYPGSWLYTTNTWVIDAPQNLIDLTGEDMYGGTGFFYEELYAEVNFPAYYNDYPNNPAGYLYTPYYYWFDYGGSTDFDIKDWIYWSIVWEIERNLNTPQIQAFGTRAKEVDRYFFSGTFNGLKFAVFTWVNATPDYTSLTATFQVVVVEGAGKCPQWIGLFYKDIEFINGQYDYYRLSDDPLLINDYYNYDGFTNMPATVAIMDYGRIAKCCHSESNLPTIHTGVAQQSYWLLVDKQSGEVDMTQLPQGWVEKAGSVVQYLGPEPPGSSWLYDTWKDQFNLL